MSSRRADGKQEPRTVKPAGHSSVFGRLVSDHPSVHGSYRDWGLGKLTGRVLRDGERPGMDRNRRP